MLIDLRKSLAAGLFGLLLFTSAHIRAQAQTTHGYSEQDVLRIAKQVRKSILTLPEYGVFDYLHFAIKGNTVILKGEASRPILKSSAENVVKKIEGVGSVENDIEVLPNSPNDDRIRAAVYRRIYGQPSLQKYTSNRGPRFTSLTRRTMGITYDPPIGYHAIHIIVKNGNVTLYGIVDNEADFAMAEMQANQTPGVFSVDNDLQVAAKPAK